MGTIVVGVDGSESSGVALEFAVEEARVHEATLRIVSVWEMPALAQPGPLGLPEVLEGLQQVAEAIVDEAVERAKELQPDLECEGVVLNGRPQNVLVEEGEGALLLVVGRRGQGGLASLLLGSVSQYVVNHAPCPVTVVPPLTRR